MSAPAGRPNAGTDVPDVPAVQSRRPGTGTGPSKAALLHRCDKNTSGPARSRPAQKAAFQGGGAMSASQEHEHRRPWHAQLRRPDRRDGVRARRGQTRGWQCGAARGSSTATAVLWAYGETAGPAIRRDAVRRAGRGPRGPARRGFSGCDHRRAALRSIGPCPLEAKPRPGLADPQAPVPMTPVRWSSRWLVGPSGQAIWSPHPGLAALPVEGRTSSRLPTAQAGVRCVRGTLLRLWPRVRGVMQ